jgi:CheY-like chemotaxis protein
MCPPLSGETDFARSGLSFAGRGKEKSMASTVLPPRRILVVDDEILVCDSIKRILKFCGYEVEMATNGEAALTLLDKSKFDLILIDYLMPVMKGDELAALIKSRQLSAPVVMITASAEAIQASGNPLEGVDFVISKPFLLEEFRDAISKIMPQAQSPG